MTVTGRPSTRATLARLVAVAVVGVAVGVATSYLQGVLPESANFTANSGAVWTLVAFGLVWWCVADEHAMFRTGVAAGVAALVGEVLGYYAVASPLRDIPTTPAERVLWTTAGFVIGAATGAAVHLARHGRPAWRPVALGAVCGVVAGEGLHAAVRLDATVQATVELLGAAVALVLVVVSGRRRPGANAAGAAVGTAVLVAAVVFTLYGIA